jgi:hypothetical protein
MTARLIVLLILSLVVALAHAGTRPDDVLWLTAKGKEEGVVTLPSGLLYNRVRSIPSVVLPDRSIFCSVGSDNRLNEII